MTSSQTEMPSKAQINAWVDLFESDISPLALLELLAVGDIPADNPEVAGALRDAFVQRLNNTAAPLSFPLRKDPSHTLHLDSPAFPKTLDEVWPTMGMDRTHEAPHEACAYLLGRLVAAAGGIGQQQTPDALDIALRERWAPLVRQILVHFTPPAEQLDSRRTPIWPWIHVLTRENRQAELKDWLAVPGINPNILSDSGMTALFQTRNVDVLDILIQAGVDPSVQANDGTTAMSEWEKRVGRHQFNPAMLQSMNERLTPVFNSNDDRIYSEVSQCLSQWLKPGDHWHWWEIGSGPDLDNLSSEMKTAIGKIQFRVTHSKQSHEWGVCAYMGMNIPSLSFSKNIRKEQALFLKKWGHLFNTMPQEWLIHESVPGVADGWILGAGLLNHEAAKITINDSHGVKLFKTLESRMMTLECPENPTQHRIQSIIRACDALLIQMEEIEGSRTKWAAILRDIAGLKNKSMDALMVDLKTKDCSSVMAECFIKSITLPGAGEYLVSKSPLLGLITPKLKEFLITRDDVQSFWDTLLRLYSKVMKGTPEKNLSKELDKLRVTFNAALESLCSTGLKPDRFKSPNIEPAIKLLPYMKDAPLLFNVINSTIQAQTLEQAITEKKEAPQMRKRM